jgi:hypothetical protein
MPLQLLAIVGIASNHEQIGEKLNSFGSLNKIPISKDNNLVLSGLFTLVNKLVKTLVIFQT